MKSIKNPQLLTYSCLTIFFICFSSNFLLKAQPIYSLGEVVMLNGDTIKGWIGEIGSLKRFDLCLFRSRQQGETITYFPGDILSFSILDKKYYKSEKFRAYQQPEATVFVEYFVEGAISLMKYRKNYYLKNSNNQFQRIPFKLENYDLNLEREKVGQLRIDWYQFIKDIHTNCSKEGDYYDDFNKLRYDLEGMINVVLNYNECLGANYEIHWEKVPFAIVDIGPGISIQRSGVSFTSQINELWYPFGSPFRFLETRSAFSSVGVEFSLPINIRTFRNPSNWSVFIEPFFHRYQFYYEILEEPIDYPNQTYTDFNMEWSGTGLTIGGRYRLPNSKPQISVQSGVRLNFLFNQQVNVIKENIIEKPGILYATRTRENPFILEDNQISLSTQINISNNWNVFSTLWELSFGFLLGNGFVTTEGSQYEETMSLDSMTSTLFLKTSFLW